MKYPIIILVCLLLISACAPKVPVEDRDAAQRIWNVLHSDNPPADRISAQFSLHVASPHRSGRLLGQLWGFPTSLIRLDLSTSAGGTMAMIRETDHLWAAYIPSENRAYHHDEARVGLRFFQIPVPFTARQISSLLAGNFAPVLSAVYADTRRTPEGTFRFDFETGEILSLEATGNADTVILRGRDGWTLTCQTPYESPAFAGYRLYEKFTFESPHDGKAVLRIKSLERGRDWTAAEMDLRPPQDATWMRLKPTALNN